MEKHFRSVLIPLILAIIAHRMNAKRATGNWWN